jgi:GDPmannose 4,6-dehydratase
MIKKALVFGITGQDGAYLSHLLLKKGYEVHGTSRDVEVASLSRLKQLEIVGKVELHSANLTDYRGILELLTRIAPDEIYNLSAQSSVGLSFDQPIETLTSIVNATLNLLEAIRFLGGQSRLYNASSSEMYGDTAGARANEAVLFRPHSPYGVSKAAAHWLVENYRNGYGLYACSGILFNHESPLRGDRFVTQKIVRAAVDISRGAVNRLSLGNVDIVRDWGWAPEYVEGMWLMLQQDQPIDFVLATGKPLSLREFTQIAFKLVGLDWEDHVDHHSSLLRPYDINFIVGDPAKAKAKLGWEPTVLAPLLIEKLVSAELVRCNSRVTRSGSAIDSLF